MLLKYLRERERERGRERFQNVQCLLTRSAQHKYETESTKGLLCHK